MIAILAWYLVITLIGWLAWPLAFRLLPGLPDRGYALSRALGLMLTGYVFWLLGSLGFLSNTVGGILFALIIVAGASLWVYLARPDRADSLPAWIGSHLGYLLAAELLFMTAFVGWATVRAYNPDIAGTEKPMELMFLNGVRASPIFPPRDPWLSGYGISYYYFGYVLVAILADLTGTASSVAFNLAIAILFALTLLGSYGLVYNLIAAHVESRHATVSALLGPLFVGVMGNLAGLFELLRSLALPFVPAAFWTWLDLEDLDTPLPSPLWPPHRWRFWWWWRASRVIRDRNPAGVAIDLQPIDEFPFFSFLLGDMHPHVLAIPFALLALGLAFNALRQRQPLSRAQLALYVVTFGGLAFLNTWDLPIYLFILIGALVGRQIVQGGSFEPRDLTPPLLTGLGILAAGIAAYLPWYISFRSQAGGFLPNALFPTRFHQFAVMFGPFLLVIVAFLVSQVWRNARHADWISGLLLAMFVLALLVGMMSALGMVVLRSDPNIRAWVAANVDPSLAGQPDAVIQAQLGTLISRILTHRLAHPLTTLFLVPVIGVTLSMLLPRRTPSNEEDERPFSPGSREGNSLKRELPHSRLPVRDGFPLSPPWERGSGGEGEKLGGWSHPSTGFALLLILTGALLTLGPEFLYLRDVFGQRLNTVFKFYYAAWILWALASSYAAHWIASHSHPILGVTFTAVLAVFVAAGMIYPAFAIPSKANFTPDPDSGLPTLDGIDYIRRQFPADYAGIEWLWQNAGPGDVVLEAVGGQYSYYGRVSMATGIPTVLGWPGHEHQWRGDLYPQLVGTREQDVREIYNTPNMLIAQELLNRYGVTYVFVGTLERDPEYASPGGLAKFDRYLPIAFQAEGVTIYRADQPLVEELAP